MGDIVMLLKSRDAEITRLRADKAALLAALLEVLEDCSTYGSPLNATVLKVRAASKSGAMTEIEIAMKTANDWLDFRMNSLVQLVPGDPDCDACIVARQLIRAVERADRFEDAISRYLSGNYSCQGGAERLFSEVLWSTP